MLFLQYMHIQNILVQFSRIVENLFPVNPEILVKKFLSVVKKLHFAQRNIFEPLGTV